MSYLDYRPIDPRDAFEVTARPDAETTQDAAAAQAALLLTARAGVMGMEAEEVARLETAEERAEFELPRLEPLRRTRRLRLEEATRPLGVSPEEVAREAATPEQLQPELARTARRLYEQPSTEIAAALFEGAMNSPHPLVQVAAAAGARETTRLRPRSRAILEEGAESSDPLVARVAQVALAHIDRHDPVIERHVRERPVSRPRRRSSSTAVITHGTFAADAAWYRPGGDFHQALADHRPDLHVHDPSFTWTGAYSHAARRADARLLEEWVGDQGLVRPDFLAHSHGGTVAHLATREGVQFDRLVHMGWPVHGEWFPDFARVNRIIDVRVRLDLVILADRGGQRFRTDFPIEEHRHGWFDHSSTHEPAYWDRHDLWDRL